MTSPPDPHGQAALMLCEGILLLLLERGRLDKDEVVSMIEDLIDVKQDMAGTSENKAAGAESTGLLRAVCLSISAMSGPPIL